MAFVIKCNSCSHRIPWKPTESRPAECPKCWASFGEERADDDVVMPFIRSPKTGRTDQVYRDMERGSEFRAQAAADQLGVPASEMSGLKMTNMNDGQREGDIAHVEVHNPVTEIMQQHPSAVGFRGGEGLEYSSAVQTGPYPNVGAHTRTMIQAMHPQMVAKHAIGINERGLPVMPNTDVISDRPAKETLAPGYRRRG